MGLLEKATKILEGRPAPGRGLFRQMLEVREKDRSARPSKKNSGLFERARRLRETVQKKGLYGRALQIQDESEISESPADVPPVAVPPPPPRSDSSRPGRSEASGLFAKAEAFRDGDTDLPTPPEAFRGGETNLPAPLEGVNASPSISEEEAGDLLFSPPESPESSLPVEPVQPAEFAETLPAEPAESLPEISPMDFSFEEQSPTELDPALQEASPDALSDPFREWEDEAGRQAEKETRDLLGVGNAHFLSGDDEGITTMPVEAHIASQKRIDNYLALFELNKELNAIDQAEEFWDSVLYSILGQIGARSVVIFTSRSNGQTGKIFYPIVGSGTVLPEEWNLKPGDEIYDELSRSEEIRYAGEFLRKDSGCTEAERDILEKSKAVLLLPLKHGEQYEGVVMVGAPIEAVDYGIEDLEYLRLLPGNILGSLKRILNIAKHAEETDTLRRENGLHRSLSSLTATAQTRKTVDEIYDLLLDFYSSGLGVESMSLVLLDPPEQEYRIFAGNRISPATLQKFRLPVGTSELIGTVSNLSGIFDLVDFRTHPEITAGYSGDDLALMQNYWILPLINLNWLVGFLTIHRTNRVWGDLDREVALMAASQMAPVLANCIILKERETLFRDPFSPLEKRLERELQKAMEFHSPLSIVDFRVKNLKKLLGANGMPAMTEFFSALSRTISRNLFQTDYITRMGAGRFVLLLPGRGRAEAGIFAERLQLELRQAPMLKGSAVVPSYDCDVINFPEDGNSMQKLIALLDR